MSQLFENQYTMPSHQLLLLDGSIRNKLRDIDGVEIPCENTLSKLKLELAVTHGTMTGVFLRGGLMGAYMSDPHFSADPRPPFSIPLHRR